MSDEPGVVSIPNNNCYVNRDGYQPRWIILHGTAGGSSAQAIANYFKSTEGGNNPVSAHYVIGRDGVIVQCNAEKDGAWANGYRSGNYDPWWTVNPNLVTVSIEHCKPSDDNSDALTDAQKQSSFKLVAHICQRHNIPARKADANGGITGHYSIDPVNRARCPGPYPWDELFAYLKTGGTMIPQGWKDNGTELTAPNGVKVVKGFRDFVLNNNWAANNWPLENEHAQNPLEMSNPALGAGTQQIFRMDTLEWTQARGTFRAYVGQEFLALRQLAVQRDTQVAALQKSIAQANATIADLQQRLASVNAASIEDLQKQLADANAWRDKAIAGLKQVGVIVVDLTS